MLGKKKKKREVKDEKNTRRQDVVVDCVDGGVGVPC